MSFCTCPLVLNNVLNYCVIISIIIIFTKMGCKSNNMTVCMEIKLRREDQNATVTAEICQKTVNACHFLRHRQSDSNMLD